MKIVTNTVKTAAKTVIPASTNSTAKTVNKGISSSITSVYRYVLKDISPINRIISVKNVQMGAKPVKMDTLVKNALMTI